MLRVILLLAMGVQGPFGLTLCLADDGHAILELAHGAAPCASEVRRHHPDAETLAEHEFARHPCRDVPLLERASYRTADAASLPTQYSVARIYPVTDLGSVRTLLAERFAATGPPKMTMRSIRSVVFLA